MKKYHQFTPSIGVKCLTLLSRTVSVDCTGSSSNHRVNLKIWSKHVEVSVTRKKYIEHRNSDYRFTLDVYFTTDQKQGNSKRGTRMSHKSGR